jgi:DNA-nicking Smr family endonuclease
MPKRPDKQEPPAEEPTDDQALLREALKGVAPIPDPGKATLHRQPPRPVPVQRLRDDEQVLQDSLSIPLEVGLETGDELIFLRDGLSNMVLRKLRRGHWATQEQLDLHGLRSEERAIFWWRSSTKLSRKAGAACASCTARACVRRTANRC